MAATGCLPRIGDGTAGFCSGWKRPGFLAVLGGLTFLLWVNNTLYFWPEVIDDSFITFRHSLNAAEGRGLVYNPPARTEAHSTPVWAVVHIIPFLFHWDVVLFSKVVGWILGTAGLAAVVIYGRRLGLRVPVIAALPLAVWTPVGFWSVVGMEMPLALALSIGVVLVHHVEVKARRPIWFTAVLLALGAQVRPEGVLFAAPVAVQHVVLLWPDWRGGLRLAVWPGIVCIVISACALSLRYLYYGAILPNPALVKMFARGDTWLETRGTRYVSGLFIHRPAFSVLLAVSCLLAARKHFSGLIVALASLAAWTAFALAARGDWMPNFRFFVPVAPFVGLLVACGLSGGLSIQFRPLRYTSTLVLIGSLCCFALAEGGYSRFRADMSPPVVEKRMPRWAIWRPARFLRAGWGVPYPHYAVQACKRVPRDGTIACYDIGNIGFSRPDVTILDLVGLGDRGMAEIRAREDVDESFLEYFFSRRPEVVYIYARSSGKGFFETDRMLMASSRFDSEWSKRASMQGWAGTVEIYLRNDLPDEQPLDQQLRAVHRMVELQPRWTLGLAEYAYLLHAAGDADSARDVMIRIVSEFPAAVRANVLAGRFFRDQRELELSSEAFANAVAFTTLRSGERYTYITEGEEYVFDEYLASLSRLRRVDEVLREGQRFNELVAGYPPVLNQMAFAAATLGRRTESIRYLEEAAQSSRTDQRARLSSGSAAEQLGDFHLSTGDLELARKWLQIALNKFVGNEDQERVRAKLSRLTSTEN